MADVQRRERSIDKLLAGLRTKHAKDIAALKARNARLLADTAMRAETATKATSTIVTNLEMENKWLRQRVADLQEIVEAFQKSISL